MLLLKNKTDTVQKHNHSITIIFLFIIGTLYAQKSVTGGELKSKWSDKVNFEHPLSEYPRPQMKRVEWQNLNGQWDYKIQDWLDESPVSYEGKITVPFPIESPLSKAGKKVTSKQRIWYRRHFEIPSTWENKRVVLNFGAVDWETEVFVNGQKVGNHQGGYDPFSFDITTALHESGKQEIIVAVWDPSDDGFQSVGKQKLDPNRLFYFYTPASGIWQTVWLEPVSDYGIESIRITPDIDNEQLSIEVQGHKHLSGEDYLTITAFDGKQKVVSVKGSFGETLTLPIKKPKLWSPDTPFLYDLKIFLTRGGKTIDKVDSYFGMRKISMEEDQNGCQRLLLNNKMLFQYGTLDQGMWPDGIYTAPTDEALKYDIEITKRLGFNTIRKHLKVEPARWYYHCDKLGIMVWQDMPNGNGYGPWKKPSGYDEREGERNPQSARQFYKEWKTIMEANHNNPSIVVWVPFNEGWGQFNTARTINWTIKKDPSRLVNGFSGGNPFPVGHMIDTHIYPGPGIPQRANHAPRVFENKAMVLGEFGGLGLSIDEHLWKEDGNRGYKKIANQQSLLDNYKALMDKMPELIKKGLAAAIYTQTTDIETEVNGLMTYDRAVIKMDVKKMNKINTKLYKINLKNQ